MNSQPQQQDVVANLLNRVIAQPQRQQQHQPPPQNPPQPAKADWQIALEEAKAHSHRLLSNNNSNSNTGSSAVVNDSKAASHYRISNADNSSRSASGGTRRLLQPSAAPSPARMRKLPSQRVEIDLAASSSGEGGDNARGGDALLGSTGRSDPIPEQVGSRNKERVTQQQQRSHQTLPAWLPHSAKLRPNFAARTLEQLQTATLRWYTYHQQRCGNVRPHSTARLMPIRFNDISVATMSHWCAQPSQTTSQPRNRPTVDTRYRKCSQCRLYGHYETECPSLTEENTIRFGNDILDLTHEEATAAPEGSNDTSFGLDDTVYDVVVELCDGFAMEQRKAPESKHEKKSPSTGNAMSSSRRTTGDEKDDDEMEIDGFTIRTAKSVETFSGKDASLSPSIKDSTSELQTSMAVLWYHPQEETASNTGDNDDDDANTSSNVITVGYVKELNYDEKTALVQVVRSIPPSSSADYSDVVVPAEFSEHWIALDHLYVNNEMATAAQSLRKRAHPFGMDGTANSGSHRSSGGDKKKKPRLARARLQHRYRMVGRINQDDMSIRPPRQTRQRPDGTWVAPAGRKPNGREWDSSRGLWVLSAQNKPAAK